MWLKSGGQKRCKAWRHSVGPAAISGGPPSGDGVATAQGGGTVRLSQEKAPLSSLVWRVQAAKRARRVAAR
eukprot:2213154-Alexandrium_andersonii.AAC.1